MCQIYTHHGPFSVNSSSFLEHSFLWLASWLSFAFCSVTRGASSTHASSPALCILFQVLPLCTLQSLPCFLFPCIAFHPLSHLQQLHQSINDVLFLFSAPCDVSASMMSFWACSEPRTWKSAGEPHTSMDSLGYADGRRFSSFCLWSPV